MRVRHWLRAQMEPEKLAVEMDVEEERKRGAETDTDSDTNENCRSSKAGLSDLDMSDNILQDLELPPEVPLQGEEEEEEENNNSEESDLDVSENLLQDLELPPATGDEGRTLIEQLTAQTRQDAALIRKQAEKIVELQLHLISLKVRLTSQ